MSDITDDADEVFRDYVTVGLPSSGAHQPPKADIRALFATIDAMVNAARVTVDAGTSRTLAAADTGKLIVFTSNSGITVTVPPGLPVNFSCRFAQAGDGIVTFSPGAGVTIISFGGSVATAGKGATASLVLYDEDEALLAG